MVKASEVIKKPLSRDRSNVLRGFSGNVIPDGGDRGVGLIEHFSLTTRGEALGHGLWCDEVFLQQIHDAINAAGEAGLKCRFTHPGLSADGMGKFLGNLKNASIEGDQVFCDLHFSESSRDTPDGDLGGYVMRFAKEDADKFGSSIVFYHDQKAEELFFVEHKNEETGDFESPDPDNVKNLWHCRLKELRGADMVDNPAANPGGLFHSGQEIAQEATQLMEYALGLEGSNLPEMAQFDVDPDRVKLFLNRFLSDHGLELIPKEKEEKMTKKNSETTDDQSTETQETAPTRADFTAELSRYVKRFGAENGGDWFTEEKTYEQAQDAHIELLEKQLTAKDEELKALNEKISSLNLGEDEPFDSKDNEGKGKKQVKDLFRVPDLN